jgi:hypothetical protein
MSSADLLALIKEHSWTRHRKVLLCAPDVFTYLQAASDKAAESEPWTPGSPEAVLAPLMGIEVHVAQDSPPGSWRLVRHDHCEVHVAEKPDGTMDVERSGVTHQECTILGESGVSSASPSCDR